MKKLQQLTVFTILIGILLFAAAETAWAQALFRATFSADLSGGQTVPPNSSTATGFAVVHLNQAETQILVNYSYSGLGSNASAAHIHGPALPGADAPAIFTLTPQATTIGGQTLVSFNVTPAQVAEFKSGLWYLDVHSTSIPNGEIRGQLKPSSPFFANLNAQQVVPPAAGSAGVGYYIIILNGAQNMMYGYLSYNTVGGGTASGGAIRGPALPGTNGALIRSVGASGGSGSNVGFSTVPFDLTLLRRGQYYIEVSSTGFPSGAFRGQIKPANKPVDFDGDNRADISIYRASEGNWYLLNSADGSYSVTRWGTSIDNIVPGDFDADGKTDLTIWRASTGDYYTLLSSTNTLRFFHFGQSGDDPRLCADYDGDGVTDYAVFRRATVAGQQSVFYIYGSVRGFYYVNWGLDTDRALIADWDGDRVADITVYRPGMPGTYWGLMSGNGQVYSQSWGIDSDYWTTGDVDGDGKSDPLVFRSSGAQAGTWYALGSANGFTSVQFGVGTDNPVPADYDGDGKTDFAVYRSGTWWILRSSGGATATNFGLSSGGDRPVPSYLVR